MSKQTPLKIESLPVELLRRIAACTPYPTIQALAVTSHKIRAAVHDWQVYKSIIDNRVHLFTPDPKNPANTATVSQTVLKHGLALPPWTRNPINPSMPADLAAKYAYADYRAYNLSTDTSLWGPDIGDQESEPRSDAEGFIYDGEPLRDFVRWGGVLAAQGHPVVQLLGHTDLQSKYGDHAIWHPKSVSPTYRYTLMFCIAVYLLSDTVNPAPPEPTSEEEEEGRENDDNRLEPTSHFSILGGTSYTSFHQFSEGHLGLRWRRLLSHLEKFNISIYYSMPNGEARMIPQQSYRDIQYEGPDVPRTKDQIDNSYEGVNITDEEVSCSAFTLLELSVKTIGVLGWQYRRLILDGRVPRFRALRWEFSGDVTEEQVNEARKRYDPRQLWGPPVALGIPFHKFMKLEEQMGGDGTGFVWSHLEGMMNQEFLEEGKWMGMYTYVSMKEIDPAMIDIAFTVIDPKDLEPRRRRDYDDETDSEEDDWDQEDDQEDGQEVPAKGEVDDEGEGEKNIKDKEAQEGEEKRADTLEVPIIAVKATGKDGLGDFVLWGKFFIKTGKVQLTKAYYKGGESGTMWDWTAFMTPFGIFGRWGSHSFGGYVWLWKEDWYGDVEGNELAKSYRERLS